MRLGSQERVDGRRKRRYARAQTPYRILRASGKIAPATLRELDALYQTLNPADLKRQVDRKLKKLYGLYEKKKKESSPASGRSRSPVGLGEFLEMGKNPKKRGGRSRPSIR
jgi:hypothetical protein